MKNLDIFKKTSSGLFILTVNSLFITFCRRPAMLLKRQPAQMFPENYKEILKQFRYRTPVIGC